MYAYANLEANLCTRYIFSFWRPIHQTNIAFISKILSAVSTSHLCLLVISYVVKLANNKMFLVTVSES